MPARAQGRDPHGNAADGDPGAASQGDCCICSVLEQMDYFKDAQ